MREILRGYTMYVGGVDYGYEVEEISCPMPDAVYTEHMYGGAVMTAQVGMTKIGLLEPTIKFQSHNPNVISLLMRPPGQRDTFTFRAALVDEMDGKVKPNLIIYEGQLAAPNPDQWQREDKSGIEYTIKNVVYYRQEIGEQPMHEIGLMPAKLVVNRIDLLRVNGYNAALGRP
ncbi:phage major tail tube protein [Methylobacterium hispanicum]|uniref:phage major tail tube protein n=1 Tax=Methylobacterium hispanicum TaxID=270350 RepID=UPI002F309DC6